MPRPLPNLEKPHETKTRREREGQPKKKKKKKRKEKRSEKLYASRPYIQTTNVRIHTHTYIHTHVLFPNWHTTNLASSLSLGRPKKKKKITHGLRDFK